MNRTVFQEAAAVVLQEAVAVVLQEAEVFQEAEGVVLQEATIGMRTTFTWSHRVRDLRYHQKESVDVWIFLDQVALAL
jgi:hypothetical protein